MADVKQALRSHEHVGRQWVQGALALEVLSEIGYVTSWRAIVDPDNLLGRDPRGVRTSRHAAWAQLGAGMVRGGLLVSIGVGAWGLRRFGMPGKTIAERRCNHSFLNTPVDALTLIVSGVGLAIAGAARHVGNRPGHLIARGRYRALSPRTTGTFGAAAGNVCVPGSERLRDRRDADPMRRQA